MLESSKKFVELTGNDPIKTLLTAKVDELLYSFNWYTSYEC